ncbi:hypothetical protein [Halomicrobium urmianum]|uniref:hypothetical protein n=1 Tax=Halomicrobium urmianum TaxID=1586233 RepID=UPI001CD97B1D|nr:hypothetical protein [Halomicrobium urmianum]
MKPLEPTRRYYERLYRDKITEDFDAVIPIIGDEGMGKSTFILQSIWIYQQVRGVEPTPESVLDTIVWGGRDEFKQALSNRPEESAICSMDAARVMYKKDAMDPDQKNLEKDLLDVRMKNNVYFLGFQDWEIVPTMLQERRAKYAFYIPSRGAVRGYSRESIDKRNETGSWPAADMKDKFPDLEGTDLWKSFRELDKQHKIDRIDSSDDDGDVEDSSHSLKDVVSDIKDTGIQDFISINPGNKQPYIDPDLIEFEYELSARKAKKVKKVLAKDPDVEIPDEVASA